MSEVNSNLTFLRFDIVDEKVHVSCQVSPGEEDKFAEFLIRLVDGDYQEEISDAILSNSKEIHKNIISKFKEFAEVNNFPMIMPDEVLK